MLVFDGHARYLLVTDGRGTDMRNLDVVVHIERHVGGRQQQCLVVEHAAHVAIEADVGLVAMVQVLVEGGGDVQNAVGLVALDEFLGLVHIGVDTRHTYVGSGVEALYELAAAGRATVVDHCAGHVAAHLVGIDIRIEQRIGQGHKEDEDHDALVAQHRAAFIKPYIDQVSHIKPCI